MTTTPAITTLPRAFWTYWAGVSATALGDSAVAVALPFLALDTGEERGRSASWFCAAACRVFWRHCSVDSPTVCLLAVFSPRVPGCGRSRWGSSVGWR